MIVVAGHLRVDAADRDAVVAASQDAVRLARQAPGCLDFAVSADPVDPERVNVYERWSDRARLEAFRGSGPDDGLGARIRAVHVEELEVVARR